MKYYIIAGEASGDLHGSNLIKEVIKKDPRAVIRGWGGELMQSAGAQIVKHYKDLAFMGFAEVVKNLPTIMKNFSFCKKDISSFGPDVLVLIDYPGFNLRMAKWAKQNGLKVIYYISPQVWAWKENRVQDIKKYVDKMLVILPFEKEFYQKWNYPVVYVGHPLVQVINDFVEQKNTTEQITPVSAKGTIALLPGSRKQEISRKLPIMLSVCKHFPEHNFTVAIAPGMESNFYQPFLAPYKNVKTVVGRTYDLLYNAKAALVTSGTATLETALFGVPQVICYKGNSISYAIAKRLVKIKFIGLVNLIMGKEVVKELIQDELNEQNLKNELGKILNSSSGKARIQKDYDDLRKLLGEGGNASEKAAAEIVAFTINS